MIKKRIIKKTTCCFVLAAAFCMAGCGGTKETEKAALSSETVQKEKGKISEEAYCGSFLGEKYIEAMGCNVEITINLEKDGTYTYHRGAMSVALEGGGDMPAMEDAGVYEVKTNEIRFVGESLGEFSLSLKEEEEGIYLEGDVPTGGAATELLLSKVSTGE